MIPSPPEPNPNAPSTSAGRMTEAEALRRLNDSPIVTSQDIPYRMLRKMERANVIRRTGATDLYGRTIYTLAPPHGPIHPSDIVDDVLALVEPWKNSDQIVTGAFVFGKDNPAASGGIAHLLAVANAAEAWWEWRENSPHADADAYYEVAQPLAAAVEAMRTARGQLEGEVCDDCGGRYDRTIWTAPDNLWWWLVGKESGMLCPGCFDDRAKAVGLFLRWVPQVDSVAAKAQCRYCLIPLFDHATTELASCNLDLAAEEGSHV